MNAHEQVKKPNNFAMPREIKQDRNPNKIIESAKLLILPENCIVDPFKQNDIQLSRDNPNMPSYPYVHQHVLRLLDYFSTCGQDEAHILGTKWCCGHGFALKNRAQTTYIKQRVHY